MKAFCNATIFTGEEFLTEHAVLVNNGIIDSLVTEDSIPKTAERMDMKKALLVPAFMDLQLYGGNGLLFSNEFSYDALIATEQYCNKGGCSRFLITMATNSIEQMMKGIEVVKKFREQNNTGLLGIHLEGPYINPLKRGAHLQEYIKQPTLGEVQAFIDAADGVLKMMTLAPEQCSEEVIHLLQKNGVVVSAGHSNATYRQATNGFNQNISAATHLFNAMSAFTSREPGMVGAIYDHPTVQSSIVCDGIHVDFASVRISKQIMKERLFLITDAVTETKGTYSHVFNKDHYTLPNRTLSGSSLTMIQAVNNCIQHLICEEQEAFRMAGLYPARVMGMQNEYGRIEKGFRADFAILDSNKEIIGTIRDGETVYNSAAV
ncbi:MAG: N-acetylglucosamine-6-phosphate deacetylase [Chitinophagaceae bacterium]|nr:N-acetylglucosamine-6-phosphate deacetylase [Chitinophagaceae bacterium]